MSVPYTVGYPITEPSDFYGLHKAISQFFDLVAARRPHSVSLLGLKRSGKTSLLYHIAHRRVLEQHVSNPDTYVALYVDFSICHTPSEFYHQVYQGLLHRLVGLSAPKYEQVPNPESSDIIWLLGQFPDRRVMLLLDEFDHLMRGRFDQDFLCQLRSIAIARDTNLAFITASVNSLQHIGKSLGLPLTSPFYNIFFPAPLRLSGLEKNKAVELIRCPAEQESIFFTDEEVENIQTMAGTLPFMLQMSARKWFIAKRNEQLLIQNEIHKELINEAHPIFESWWEDLGEENRFLLGEIAQKESVSTDSFQNPESEDGVHLLKNYGLVIEEEGKLHVNGLVLTAWIRKQITKPQNKPSIGNHSKKTVVITDKPNPERNLFVYIIHASEDKSKVQHLCKRLKQDNFNPWLAEERILPGQDKNLEIEKALQRSRVILVCFSKLSVQKEGSIQSEYRRAMKYQEEKPEGAIFVIPIRLDACETPESIRHLEGVNLFEADSYNKLLQAITAKDKEF